MSTFAFLNRNAFLYNLRLVMRIIQPQIGRKIGILQPGPEKHYSYTKKRRLYCIVIRKIVTSLLGQKNSRSSFKLVISSLNDLVRLILLMGTALHTR